MYKNFIKKSIESLYKASRSNFGRDKKNVSLNKIVMHLHAVYLLLCLLCSPLLCLAQTAKQTTSLTQTWFGYLNQTRLSNRWGIWFDAQLYTKDHMVRGLYQSELRPGVMFYLNDNTKLAAGYTHLNNFPIEGHSKISRPEHRAWQQVQWHTKYPHVNTMQWFRLEERFVRKVANDSTLGKGSIFTWRMRYNFLMNIPISVNHKPTPWAATVNNEVFVSFGKNVTYNYFDQNRFFAGATYRLSHTSNLQAGYLNVFQQLAAGNKYRMIHAARIYYFHTLDVRKKTPGSK